MKQLFRYLEVADLKRTLKLDTLLHHEGTIMGIKCCLKH